MQLHRVKIAVKLTPSEETPIRSYGKGVVPTASYELDRRQATDWNGHKLSNVFCSLVQRWNAEPHRVRVRVIEAASVLAELSMA